jgi:hypothetical protein
MQDFGVFTVVITKSILMMSTSFPRNVCKFYQTTRRHIKKDRIWMWEGRMMTLLDWNYLQTEVRFACVLQWLSLSMRNENSINFTCERTFCIRNINMSIYFRFIQNSILQSLALKSVEALQIKPDDEPEISLFQMSGRCSHLISSEARNETDVVSFLWTALRVGTYKSLYCKYFRLAFTERGSQNFSYFFAQKKRGTIYFGSATDLQTIWLQVREK